jgi:hypothetical protein
LKRFEDLKSKFSEQRKIEESVRNKLNEWLESNRGASDEEYSKVRNRIVEKAHKQIIGKGLNILPEIAGKLVLGLEPPQRWRPLDDVAKEKAAETFSNVALHAYDEGIKRGKKAPLIAVENVYPEWTLSRADSLKGMIKEAKKNFVKRLVKERGLGKNEAKKIAEESMGVTWDVGHINQLRKYGYTEEDVVKETKKIAKEIKHLHITDNFGYSDSHLTPGMGNVPIEKQLKEIEKAQSREEFAKIRKVVEGGGMWQQYQTSPTLYSAEGLGSPFYAYDHGPTWTDVRDIYSSYLFGYGNMLPEQHYRMKGAGFSMLPKELGGQVGGGDKGSFATNQ